MRDRGTFNFSGNLEVKKDAPLEARSLVNSYADLVKPETWTDEQGGIWKYDCMLVSCKDRPGEVYQLQPGADYTKQSSWILIGDTSELNSKVQQFINSKGAPNGLASLNESGIIPSAQLPSYVDDVIEVDTFSDLPGTGESGKIYIVQDTNLTYRWSGTDYVEISKSLALGETSSTAYSGDKGKATTDKLNRIPDKLITDTVNVNQSTTEAVLNFTTYRQEAQQVGRNTLTITSATISQAGLMSSSDKTKLDKIITNGDGTKYLADNGQYKTVQGGSADIEAIKKYVDDSVTSARSIGYMMQLTEIDASGLDENTWYPVTITAGARMCMRAEVLVALDSGTKPSWSTHERGFSTRKIWEWAPSTWGINAVSDIKVYLSDFAHTNLDPVRGLDFLGHFDTCFVFVRGGGKYHFYTSHGAQVILHTSTYKPSEASDQSVSPTTTTPKPINALDLRNYGKVIDVPNGSYLTLNVNRVGADAIDYINNVFGSKDRLKEVIMDIIENHQRYLFHSYASNLNCVEPNNVYAYYDDAKNEYNLQYNLSYYTTNGPVSKRAGFLVTPYNEGYKVEVTDLATSWNNLPDVITEGNEFNIADNNINSSYFWINYRPRSGSTTNAKNIYVGNGQGSGGFGEVHASGFFKESDIRLKSNIVPLNHTLEQICNIPTVSFDIRNKHQIGTIAQDIENDFVDIVDTDSDGMKSVDYCMLGVVAVEGIKLLKQEIEDLKKQVEELKNGK